MLVLVALQSSSFACASSPTNKSITWTKGTLHQTDEADVGSSRASLPHIYVHIYVKHRNFPWHRQQVQQLQECWIAKRARQATKATIVISNQMIWKFWGWHYLVKTIKQVWPFTNMNVCWLRIQQTATPLTGSGHVVDLKPWIGQQPKTWWWWFCPCSARDTGSWQGGRLQATHNQTNI